jgi:hypothetical protein
LAVYPNNILSLTCNGNRIQEWSGSEDGTHNNSFIPDDFQVNARSGRKKKKGLLQHHKSRQDSPRDQDTAHNRQKPTASENLLEEIKEPWIKHGHDQRRMADSKIIRSKEKSRHPNATHGRE